jgi:hypothetical protein
MQSHALPECLARRGWTITLQVREVVSSAAKREAREKLLEAGDGLELELNRMPKSDFRVSKGPMTIFGGVLLYLSLIGLAVSLISLLKPLRFLGIRTRRTGLRGLGFSVLLLAAGSTCRFRRRKWMRCARIWTNSLPITSSASFTASSSMRPRTASMLRSVLSRRPKFGFIGPLPGCGGPAGPARRACLTRRGSPHPQDFGQRGAAG